MKQLRKQLKGALRAGLLVIAFVAPAHATLIDRGNGLIYDNVMDITWTQNANFSGQTFTWQEARDWAGNLVFGGFDDWRLPTSLFPPCGGQPCTGSEMGHMYYSNLGGGTFEDLTGDQTSVNGVDLFDIQSRYWSESAPFVTLAVRFDFSDGIQGANRRTDNYSAWAVRPGDSVVPLPAAVWLFGSALIGLLGVAKRKR